MNKINITTPQFKRAEGERQPALPPLTIEQWEALRTQSVETLAGLGLCAWNDPNDPQDVLFDGKTLMLFPGEWYSVIPKGYEITVINGETESFKPGETDDDIRFGDVLPMECSFDED